MLTYLYKKSFLINDRNFVLNMVSYKCLYNEGADKMALHTFVVLAYKESIYLETCIKSVLNQKYKSDVVIATSTPNDFIYNLANKYNLRVIVNNEQKHGIGYDFDFARTCVNSEMVTIAHQDDIYEYDYSNEVIQAYKKNQDSLIVFTDYFEVRNHKKVYSNTNLKIKRLLLTPLKVHNLTNFKLFKRSVLAFGNSICCPAVTFCNKNISLKEIFASDLKCDVDWLAWERVSKEKGRFIFVNKPLMGHRIHEESTTTSIIEGNIRGKEDLFMFKKFWPEFIAKFLTKAFAYSEKSNEVK